MAHGAAAPEKAMAELVATPDLGAKDTGQVGTAKEVVSSILHSVQPQMTEWDKSHLPGDDIEGWIEQRAAAEKQFTVDEAVNRDLEEWKFHNPEPDKVNDKVAHENWEKQLAAQQGQSRQANESSYEQFLAQQEEKNRGMSKQEFMRKYARLLQLRAITDKYAMNLQGLRVSAYKTPEYKAGLAQAEAQLESQRAEIALLEGELQFDAIKSGSIWKQFIIPAAVGIAMVAGPMGAAANEA